MACHFDNFIARDLKPEIYIYEVAKFKVWGTKFYPRSKVKVEDD